MLRSPRLLGMSAGLRPLRHYTLIVLALCFFCASLWLFSSRRHPQFSPRPLNVAPAYNHYKSTSDHWVLEGKEGDPHPIDNLIAGARHAQEEVLARRSPDTETAALRYRERRGRHPPPGFGEWMKYAIKADAIVVEEFFDRVYHDIGPFWALDPSETAARAATWETLIRVRGGEVKWFGGSTPHGGEWTKLLKELLDEVSSQLPDVDIPVSILEEPRVLVPWEQIQDYSAREVESRALFPEEGIDSTYSGLGETDAFGEDGLLQPSLLSWHASPESSAWDLARVACAPNFPATDVPALKDLYFPPLVPAQWEPSFAHEGFVQNSTAATDTCLQPHLRGMHSAFIEPAWVNTTESLVPLFVGSKLSVGNEILIPSAGDLGSGPSHFGMEYHGPEWEDKQVSVLWRGVGSGHRSNEDNWPRFHRHRLVEMLNGTTVSRVERTGRRAKTFAMSPVSWYDFPRRRQGTVGQWLSGQAVAGLVDFGCSSSNETPNGCTYLLEDFSEVGDVPEDEQYVAKIIPDVDGESAASGNFRNLLLSTSVPLRATLYTHWYDDRVTPWLHFVPMDNTFRDLHAVLDYFGRDAQGDAAARLIAEEGKAWAEKVLRREDMLLYVWRVLLEFARVCDKKRDRLGYVDDLRSTLK